MQRRRLTSVPRAALRCRPRIRPARSQNAHFTVGPWTSTSSLHCQGRTGQPASSTLGSSPQGLSRGSEQRGWPGQPDGHRLPSVEGCGRPGWGTAILTLPGRKGGATASVEGKRDCRQGIKTSLASEAGEPQTLPEVLHLIFTSPTDNTALTRCQEPEAASLGPTKGQSPDLH